MSVPGVIVPIFDPDSCLSFRLDRKWIGPLVLLTGFFFALAQPAEAKEWLFRTDPASSLRSLTPPPGQVVLGLPHVRRLTDGQDLSRLTAQERRTIQPNYAYRAQFVPNDPDYSIQWNFPLIHVPEAWDSDQISPLYGGDPNIIVAVVDTGVAFENYQNYAMAPDFQNAAFWTNSGEIAGDGVDNDGNGLVDDLHGWDFVNNDAHPNDDNGHGTHVAGTIAETSNNDLAAAGIAWQSTIMPLKVLDNSGSGTTDMFAAAVNYAVAGGADIINLSLGGLEPDPILETAITSAINRGVVVVAAAGNGGKDSLDYPARYSGVLAVGAVQYDTTRASYSNYGPELDVMAPGGNLALDQNGDGQPDGIAQQTCTSGACSTFDTFFYSGTSQATAHVSAAAALLEACGSAGGTIIGTLESTAADLGPIGRDNEYGYGLVNVSAALATAGCAAIAPDQPGAITGQASAKTTVPVYDRHTYPYPRPVFSWSGPAGAIYRVSWGRVGQTVTPLTQTDTRYAPSINTEGLYELAVSTVDALGRVSTSRKFDYRFRRSVFVVSLGRSIRLYKMSAALIRSFNGPFGQRSVRAIGGSLERDDTNRIIAVDRDAGSTVKILDTRGRVLKSLTPFGSSFSGVIDAVVVDSSVAEPQLVVSTASLAAVIRWYRPNGAAIRQQLLYRTYHGGLRLASGDLDGDGQDELIVVQARGSEIRVYNRAGQRLSVFRPLGSNYQGGWQVTSGDWEGDGREEIVLMPNSSSTSRPVYLTTLKGVVKKVWRMKIAGVTQPIGLAAVDVDGNGQDELLALPAQAPLVLYQWSLGGLNQRLIKLSTSDRDGRLSSLR